MLIKKTMYNCYKRAAVLVAIRWIYTDQYNMSWSTVWFRTINMVSTDMGRYMYRKTEIILTAMEIWTRK
jgi:hypothetical protein